MSYIKQAGMIIIRKDFHKHIIIHGKAWSVMLISQAVYFALKPLSKYVDYCPHGKDVDKITQYYTIVHGLAN